MTMGDYSIELPSLETDLKCLNGMLEHSEYIKMYYPKLVDAGQDVDRFTLTAMIDAINMRVQALTELSVQISREFQHKFYELLPWAFFRKMRNTISHDYGMIDQDALEAIVKNIDKITHIIEELLDHFEYA